ncbi:MAG: aminotransferase class V-fold PLP-dependent enzyme [Dehalococcoidia bacterium]|nr:aminotransferase class V-fold PLP-dependent enzyme [Dehalococcoidia bacterium]
MMGGKMTAGDPKRRSAPERPVYFDNAATSWPKPPEVAEAVFRALSHPMGNPGRSGHRLAVEAGRLVLGAREALAELFGVADPASVVLTKNATEALNLAIFGLVRPGDHVVTTSMEHNSVMRPLRHLEASHGVEVTVAPCSPEGFLDPGLVRQALRPTTRLVVTTHASNVVGALLPVAEVADICRKAGVPYLVDAAQTAGVFPIDVEEMGIDMLAFTGHKGLLGPTGTGGLVIRDDLDLEPLTRGGTGSLSDREVQPEFAPDRYESGTLNVAGLAGLAAGVNHILQTGVARIREHELRLVSAFQEWSSRARFCRTYGQGSPERQVATISFNLGGVSPDEVGRLLDSEFNIMSRIGLHCAPIAHRTLGTFPVGTVRFSWGMFNSLDEIEFAGEALAWIAARRDAISAEGQR